MQSLSNTSNATMSATMHNIVVVVVVVVAVVVVSQPNI
jgi:hypothetical protein